MAKLYSVYSLPGEELLNRDQEYPRRGHPEPVRKNPGALVPNCPSELVGKAYLLQINTRAPLGAYEKYGPAEYGTPDFETGTIPVTYPAVAVSIETRKAAMISTIKAKVSQIEAAGFTYAIPGESPTDPHVYAITDSDQWNMNSIGGLFALEIADAHGGFWRDMSNVHVTMTQAQCIAFFAAAAAYKSSVVRRMWTLIACAEVAANDAALDLIDIDAGTIDGDGGWPANGS